MVLTGLGPRVAPPVGTRSDLQAQIDALPLNGVLDIASDQYVNPAPVVIGGGKSIIGNPDAVVGIVPSTLRVWQTLIVRGAGVVLDGFQVAGNMPSGSGSNVLIEGQHTVEIQGADDWILRNLFLHNAWGDAVALQKDSGGGISHRGRILNCYADEIGRCMLTPIAIDDLTVREFNSGSPTNPFKTARINRNVCDIEPPGVGGWQCTNMLWHNCDVRKAGGDNSEFLGRFGIGSDHLIDMVVLDTLFMHGNSNYFSVVIQPADAAHGGPVRDGRYYLQSCGSTQAFGGKNGAFQATRVDGLELHDYQQATTGGAQQLDIVGCTGVVTDATVVHQRADETAEWYAYDDGTYWKWSD